LRTQFAYITLILAGSLLLSACAQAPQPTATARIIVVTATAPPASAAPQPTRTPTPIPPKPIPPTPTEETVSGTPFEDWELFEGDGFAVWLPKSFVGGSNAQDLADVVKVLRDSGQEQLAQSLEANLSYIKFYALDTTVNNPNNYFTNLNVILEQNAILNSWTAEDYVDLSLSQLNQMNGVEILDVLPFSIPGFEAYKLLAEYDMMVLMGIPGTARSSQYLLKNGDRVWVLTYFTSVEEYADRSADFDASAMSFTED